MILISVSATAYGQGFRFENLTKKDVQEIMEDFSGVMTHTSSSGAAPLAEGIRYEVGALGTYAQTPNVERLAEGGGDEDYSHLPNLGVLGRLGLSELLLVEGVYLPSSNFEGYSIQITSFAAQFNILQSDPFNFAIKLYRTNGAIDYDQMVDQFDTQVEIEDTITGAQALISESYGNAEPYFGIGVVNHDGKINAIGKGSIFNLENVTATSSVDATGGSTHVFAGAQFYFSTFNIGIEAARLYDNIRVGSKAALEF